MADRKRERVTISIIVILFFATCFIGYGNRMTMDEKTPSKQKTKEETTTIAAYEKTKMTPLFLKSLSDGKLGYAYEKRTTDVLEDLSTQTALVTPYQFLDRLNMPGAFSHLPAKELWGDYETMKGFYKHAKNTSRSPEELCFDQFLKEDLRMQETDNPSDYQILIYHTHSQECFIDSPDTNPERSIVAVGEKLKTELEKRGIKVLHLTDNFDVVNGRMKRSGAYDRASEKIIPLLKEHQSIEVVLDLHRDGVGENVHLVTQIDGKQVATLMLFNGICRDTSGRLLDVDNPYEQTNLAFGYQLRLAMEMVAPGVCRTNYLKKGRYNLHMCKKSLLIEVGAQTNTLSEALEAMPYLADALCVVLGR